MKKTIVTSILGVIASVATVGSSYGQGSVFFNNYDANTDAIVRYAATGVPAGKEGLAVSGGTGGSGFKADLLYQFGVNPTTPAISADIPQAFRGTSDGDGPSLAGYFIDGVASIPGYTGGSITFTVRAFNGADFDSSLIRGQTTFTLNGISVAPSPAGDFGPAFLPFTVQTVPEPSTFALIGLGTGALLFLRRRK